MEHHTTLRIAHLIIKGLRILAWFCLVLMVSLAILALFAPDQLNMVELRQQQLTIAWQSAAPSEDTSASIGVLLFNFAKIALHMVLLLLILRPAQSILHSIKQLDTFHQQNVKALHTMGRLFFIWWIVSWFHVSQQAATLRFGLHFDLTLLICAIVAYVLAAVFQEGNRLMEENQLTI